MKKRISMRLGLMPIALAIIGLLAVAQQPEPQYKELPNFHQVNERLYRGGQPKRGGLERLAALGIKTVVNLRGEGEGANEEKAEAESQGMRYFNVPMSNAGRPTDEQVTRVIAIIDDPANAPVFIHCRLGADRTGAIIAMYRIKHDGWTDEQAIKEANQYGMGWIQYRKRDYISDAYKQQRSAAAAAATGEATERKNFVK